MEHKILVVYVGIIGIRSEDIDTFVHKVASKIVPTTFDGEIIIIPTQQLDTRIECINPKYITEPELIQEHTVLIKELQEALLEQLSITHEQKTRGVES
jgi:hypothetical protein